MEHIIFIAGQLDEGLKDTLEVKGYTVLHSVSCDNVLRTANKPLTLMRYDLANISTSGAIVLLHNWQDCKEAVIMRDICQRIGIRIYYPGDNVPALEPLKPDPTCLEVAVYK